MVVCLRKSFLRISLVLRWETGVLPSKMRARTLQASLARGDLVGLAKNGSTEAFDALVEAFQGQVYALAYRILGNAEDARDVQQETFIRAWRSLGALRDHTAVKAWLLRITVNLCRSRRSRNDICLDDVEAVSGAHDLSRGMERSELAANVRRVIAGMPFNHRLLLVVRLVEDRPFDEIAGILGCSQHSARARFWLATKMLRGRMRPYLDDQNV